MSDVVVVVEDRIEVVSVGMQGPAGPQGPQGDPATNLITSVNGMTGAVTLGKADVGLGAVDNTSDADKPLSAAMIAALNAVLSRSGGTMTGDIVMSSGKTVRFSAATGDSRISRTTVYQALDDYSRAWEVWLDKNGRNQAGIGWHGINSDDGVVHNAWEVKTSVSPDNATPGLMQTRIGIQSEKDKADFVMNYLDRLRLYKGDGSNLQTWNVSADTGSTEQLGEFKSKDAAGTSYITMFKKPTAGAMLQSVEATGSATLDFEATPLDGTSSGLVRLFRNTNTTNTGTAFAVYNATGANVLQHYFSAKGNSYVNAFGGNFGVGTSSPQTKLDVNGDSIRIRNQRTIASPTTSGVQGEICYDNSYLYVCIATNTWRRLPLQTWA